MSACHICSPLILDNSPVPSFPLLGPEPSLRGGFPSHRLSYGALHPGNGGSLHCPPAPGLSFPPDKGGPQAEKGHQRRHVARGGNKKRGGGGGHAQHRSIPPSFLQQPWLAIPLIIFGPSNTLPHPQPRFLQLGVLHPESHAQLGRRVKLGGGGTTSLSRGPCKLTTPTPLLPASATGGSFAKATRPQRLGVGAAGGQASGAP